MGSQTGASPTPATGGRSGSDPVAASEEEHPLHDLNSTAISPSDKTPRKLRQNRRLRHPASRRKRRCAGTYSVVDLNPTMESAGPERQEEKRGARRAEVRRILGGRRRSDPPCCRAHCRDQEARK